MAEFILSRLPVTDGHELQIYETGAPDGVPVIYLHGGPGSGFSLKRADLFDLSKIRFISFDQRGCGQSTPGGTDGLAANTTALLVEDIEFLRQKLQIERPILCGHSWGTSLAIEYAKRYPQHVAKIVLISTFLARKQDQDWSFEGAAAFFPDAYAEMVAGFPGSMDAASFLYNELISGDQERMAEATYRFDLYGSTICSLSPEPLTRTDITDQDINRARLLLHYAAHDFFLDPAQGILADIEALRNTEVAMIHGRYDMDCLPGAAYQLASALPGARLTFTMGNHFISDEIYGTAVKTFLAAETAFYPQY